MTSTADRYSTARAALANLTESELDAVLEAARAHRATLAAQVRSADDRAIAKGARQKSRGEGYHGQHFSTDAKRDLISNLDAALPVIHAATTAAWCQYGARVVADAEVAA